MSSGPFGKGRGARPGVLICALASGPVGCRGSTSTLRPWRSAVDVALWAFRSGGSLFSDLQFVPPLSLARPLGGGPRLTTWSPALLSSTCTLMLSTISLSQVPRGLRLRLLRCRLPSTKVPLSPLPLRRSRAAVSREARPARTLNFRLHSGGNALKRPRRFIAHNLGYGR